MKRELYPWQEQCLERWFANQGRGIVQAVTGSGKTLLALTAARRLEERLKLNLHIKIVVPTSALMQQWNRAIRVFLADSGKTAEGLKSSREEIGMRGGGFSSDPDRKYMIYVINSARYELARQILAEIKQGDSVLLIADECHHYASGQNQLIFEFLPFISHYPNQFFSLGLSATLPRDDSRHILVSALGRIIYNYGMKEASANQTVCHYDVYHISLPFLTEERNKYEEFSCRMTHLYRRLLQFSPSLKLLSQKELYGQLQRLAACRNQNIARTASSYIVLSYKRRSLVCLASARIACACDLINLLNCNERIIIFSERTVQADMLYQLLQESCPEQAGRYHSKMGNQANKNTLERFRTGSIRILIACKAIDEGIDIPDASVGIILSGSSTRRQRTQRLGRIIRKSRAKKYPALYYLHVAESSEDSCFLPDQPNRRLFELSYDSDRHGFSHPAYDARAAALLDTMYNAHAGEDQITEIKRCLEMGRIRSDWLLEQNELHERIENARYTGERNYWFCMKRLAGIEC